MKKKFNPGIFVLLILAVWLASYLHFSGLNIALFNSQGLIAQGERQVIISHILIMLIVVIPLFVSLFVIVWKYRSSNTTAKYLPDWSSNTVTEVILWVVPSIIIVILAVSTWISTHQLDPYKPIQSSNPPLTIQVVALQWKWLFIYPQQNIATVNFIEFPVNTPLNFELTADAPMNSFWIPQLGGQMYAMAGMGTQLHLIANQPGEYAGSDAEISGQGFAGMKFIAKATSGQDFNIWVQAVKNSPNTLDLARYNQLAQPSENTPVTFYSSSEANLYDKVIMKFMSPILPTTGPSQSPVMPGMENMPGMNY